MSFCHKRSTSWIPAVNQSPCFRQKITWSMITTVNGQTETLYQCRWTVVYFSTKGCSRWWGNDNNGKIYIIAWCLSMRKLLATLRNIKFWGRPTVTKPIINRSAISRRFLFVVSWFRRLVEYTKPQESVHILSAVIQRVHEPCGKNKDAYHGVLLRHCTLYPRQSPCIHCYMY